MNKTYKLNQLHFFIRNNENFVFNSENLRLYLIDEEYYNDLMKLQKLYGYNNQFELENETILNELLEEEIAICIENNTFDNDIIKLNSEEEIENNTSEKKDELTISNITLQLANDCNLNCLYCYGDGGSYGRKRELMDFKTAKAGIDLMVKNSNNLTDLTITFFGGEPLMNVNVIKQVIDYCKELGDKTQKNFHYSMTTNGTILNDEIYQLITDNKINVMISMDGDKEIQDTYRCYESGRGSYEDIVKNISRFKKANGGNLSVRSTICKPNLKLKQIEERLRGIGFSKVNMTVVDTRKDSPLFVGNDSKEELLENYWELAENYIDNIKSGKKQVGLFDNLLRNLYFKEIKMQSCSAGFRGYAIGTDGKVYPCHRFMGMEDYSVGDLDNGIDLELTHQYRSVNVFTKEDCNSCWAKFLCGGGCTHTSVSQEEDIFKAPSCYCDTYRGIFEITLYIYYKLKQWNEDVFNDIFEKEKNVQLDC